MRDIAKAIDGEASDAATRIDGVLHAWDQMTELSQVAAPLQKLDDLRTSLSALRSEVDYQDGALLRGNRSYSDEITSILSLPKEWPADPIKNLWVSANRLGQNIETVEKVAKCGGQSLAVAVIQLDVGIPKLQTAQKQFLDWIDETKQRVAIFRKTFL